jgi:hypothetical protein
MFDLDDMNNSHLIEVFLSYQKDINTQNLDRIKKGRAIVGAFPDKALSFQAIFNATQAFPIEAGTEKMSSLLSRVILKESLGIDKGLLDMCPEAFDYTLLLLGVIHQNYPAFLMEYKREILKTRKDISTLKLVEIQRRAHGNQFSFALSFADKSLSLRQLKRANLVSFMSPGIVTVFNEDELVHVLEPVFKKHGIDIHLDTQDEKSLVKPITFNAPKTMSVKAFCELLASLYVEGVEVDTALFPVKKVALFLKGIEQKITKAIVEKENVRGLVNLLHRYQILLSSFDGKIIEPFLLENINILTASLLNAFKEKDIDTVKAIYGFFPSDIQPNIARDLVEIGLSDKALLPMVDFFLKELNVGSPYEYQYVGNDKRTYAAKEKALALSGIDETKKVTLPYFYMFARTQDQELNKYTGARFESYGSDDMVFSEAMPAEAAVARLSK